MKNRIAYWTSRDNVFSNCCVLISNKYQLPTSMGFLIAMVTTNDEVTASLCAAGRFTLPLYEVVNLAPFVTSFSTKLMASWQLYGRHVLRVVMQYNYMKLIWWIQSMFQRCCSPWWPLIVCLSLLGSNRGFHSVQSSHSLAVKKISPTLCLLILPSCLWWN